MASSKGKVGGVYDGAIYGGRGTRKVPETVSTRGEWVLPLGLKEQGDDGAGTRTQRGWHLESHPVGTVARQGEKQGMNSMTALSCRLLIPLWCLPLAKPKQKPEGGADGEMKLPEHRAGSGGAYGHAIHRGTPLQSATLGPAQLVHAQGWEAPPTSACKQPIHV